MGIADVSMWLGYNTNGFAHHRLDDAIAIISEIGYRGVAITLDHGALNPLEAGWREQARRVRAACERAGLRVVVETGGRFVLDARRKHWPTLVSARQEDRERRVRFLVGAVEVAVEVGSGVVSLWSGAADDAAPAAEAYERLVSGLAVVLARAEREGVVVGFEPEPGMFVGSLEGYEELRRRVGAAGLRLTLDVGHAYLTEPDPLIAVRRWAREAVNVHMEDIRRPVHEHLFFGEGEVDVAGVVGALREGGYAGGLYVELPRHSHDAVRVAGRAYEVLSPLVAGGRAH